MSLVHQDLNRCCNNIISGTCMLLCKDYIQKYNFNVFRIINRLYHIYFESE